MRQNSKSFEDNPTIDERLVNFTPLKITNALIQTDGSPVTSQEPSRMSGGVASNMVVEGGEMNGPNVVARDMTLLADVVVRRRATGRDDLNARDSFAVDANDSKDSAFLPIGIVLYGEDEVHVVDSIERAVECL